MIKPNEKSDGKKNNFLIIAVTIVVLIIVFFYFRDRQQKRDLDLRRLDRQVDVLEEWGTPRTSRPVPRRARAIRFFNLGSGGCAIRPAVMRREFTHVIKNNRRTFLKPIRGDSYGSGEYIRRQE